MHTVTRKITHCMKVRPKVLQHEPLIFHLMQINAIAGK